MRHIVKTNLRRSRLVVFVAGLLLVALGLVAGPRTPSLPAAPPKEGASGLPSDLQLVPKRALAFASFNVKALTETELARAYEKAQGPGGEAGKEFQHVLQMLLRNFPAPFQRAITGFLGSPAGIERISAYAAFKMGGNPPFDAVLLLRTRDNITPANLLAQVGKTTRKTAAGHTYYRFEDMALDGVTITFVRERLVALGPREEILALLDRKPEQPPAPLREALALAAGKTQLVAWVDLDNSSGAAFKEGMTSGKDVPAELKQLQNVKHAVLTASLDRALVLSLALKMPDEDSAKSLARYCQTISSPIQESVARLQGQLFARDDSPSARLIKHLVAELKQTTFENEGSLVRMKMPFRLDRLADNWQEEVVRGLKDMGNQSTEQLQQTTRRTMSQNNLKQMALAMYNYAGVNKSFPPPAVLDKSGKPLLSWRVAILPFVEEDTLYKRFKLDEPWDSEHNIKLLSKMPRIYAVPEVKKGDQDAWRLKGSTFYQAVVGPGAAFEAGKLMTPRSDFLDGTSNTILVVEAGESVPWTKPMDVVFDPAKPLPKLGGIFETGTHVVLADGSVRFIPRTKPQGLIKEWMRRNSGEVRSAGLDDKAP